MLPDEIIAKDWGTNPMDLRDIPKTTEMRPTQLHLKQDGAKDGPSFAIVLQREHTLVGTISVVGQMSLTMLNESLNKLGYNIVKL